MYIYLSNEQATKDFEIYFDDLKIDHYKVSRVIQSDDYYPFGLTIAGTEYQRIGVKENRYLYNDKELQSDLDLNWYDYGARMYMPELGRWGVVDPMNADHTDYTPYNYVFNNPILLIDPYGEDTTKLDPVYIESKKMSFLQALIFDVSQFVKNIKTGDFKIGGGRQKFGMAQEGKKANDITDETKADKVIHADGDALKEIQEGLAPVVNLDGTATPASPTLNDVYESVSDYTNYHDPAAEMEVGTKIPGAPRKKGIKAGGQSNISDSTIQERNWTSDGEGNWVLDRKDTVPRLKKKR